MSTSDLTMAEIDSSLGLFDSIFRAVAADRRAGEQRSRPFDRFLVDTATSMSGLVSQGRLDQPEFDQLLWGLIQVRKEDPASFDAALNRIEPQLHPQLRDWQRAVRDLNAGGQAAAPSHLPLRPARAYPGGRARLDS